MICDAMSEDEIYEAYLLYASLHGLATDETEVRRRIASYQNNVPDESIDIAILAYAEDRIVAPPDVVVPRWGHSRIYELHKAPDGSYRHKVNEQWFDNGCQFESIGQKGSIFHFWIGFEPSAELTSSTDKSTGAVDAPALEVGTRLRFTLQNDLVEVSHRKFGEVGILPRELSKEISKLNESNTRYLPLVDEGTQSDADQKHCKVLVTAAGEGIKLPEIVDYAARAFTAVRANC